MTRQKKELMKKIGRIQAVIFAEGQMGNGFTPTSWYKDMYDEMGKYEDELARLCHFSSAERMMWDMCGELADLR